MAGAAAGSIAMTEAGKDLAGRARPPQALAVPPYETSPSFPRGHLAMGLSRVFLGHHWFTDVVAGFIAGTAGAIVVILAYRVLLRVQHRRAERSRTGSGV
jgi:undecaprenyl-diphosphatase